MAIRNFEMKQPQLAENVFIDVSAVVIGDVSIDQDSSVWPLSVVRGDINSIKIGKKTNIQDGTIIHVTHAGEFNADGYAVTIGDNVTVGHQVVLHGCTIQNECLIGMGSRVLDGAVIESHVVVGAGSLVPPGKILTSGYLWLGAPVRQIRLLTEKEMRYFKYSAEYYANLKQRYLEQI